MKNGKYDEDGDLFWYQDNQLHRLGAPAVELGNGTKAWYQHGKLHREDGPAVQILSGLPWWKNEQHKDNIECQWFLNGIELTEEEFNQWLTKKNLNEKLNVTLLHKSTIKRSKI